MHTIDDDVTYERMKKSANKKNFYSLHRKLSWQCDRDVKQYERDRDLTTFGLAREKTSMIDRLAKLQEAQKKIGSRRHSEPSGRRGRRSSEPCISLPSEMRRMTLTETLKEEPKYLEESGKRGDGVAGGMGDAELLTQLRRLPTSSTGSSSGVKRNGSLDEKRKVVREESA